MNPPALIIVVIIGAIISWFIMSFIFFPLGSFLYKVWEKTINRINKEDKKENKGEKDGK